MSCAICSPSPYDARLTPGGSAVLARKSARNRSARASSGRSWNRSRSGDSRSILRSASLASEQLRLHEELGHAARVPEERRLGRRNAAPAHEIAHACDTLAGMDRAEEDPLAARKQLDRVDP